MEETPHTLSHCGSQGHVCDTARSNMSLKSALKMRQVYLFKTKPDLYGHMTSDKSDDLLLSMKRKTEKERIKERET